MGHVHPDIMQVAHTSISSIQNNVLHSEYQTVDKVQKPNDINPLQCSGHYMYIQRSAILHSAHTLYLSVLYGSKNKQQLFPWTASTDWFV